MNEILRRIPAVNAILQHPSIAELLTTIPREIVVEEIRQSLGQIRTNSQNGELIPIEEEIIQSISRACRVRMGTFLQPVINATGVLIHTNLGRSPLSSSVLEKVFKDATGYCNLEMDLHSGQRGDRYSAIKYLLRLITGAQDSIVVNNNAAAVLLVLKALAANREVIVSRGELVEIGGGFRVPDVILESGCHLREVGTTNKTRLSDYERAITEKTAVILKVHPSNYRVVGFTESADRAKLAELCHKHGIWFIEDLGSGALLDFPAQGGYPEPLVPEVVSIADVVTYSGDKLFGGPQAGFISGKATALSIIKQQPLLRAMRSDKLTLAIIQEMLLEHIRGNSVNLPLWQMAKGSTEEMHSRAQAWMIKLHPTWRGQVVGDVSTIGGGSLPEETIPTYVLALSHQSMNGNEIASFFRDQCPPIIGRVKEGRFLLDPRTVRPDDDGQICGVLAKGGEGR